MQGLRKNSIDADEASLMGKKNDDNDDVDDNF